MIPFDISGTVHIPTTVRSNSATVKAVANRLAAMLDEKDCDDVYVEGSRVRFHNKWFGGTLRFGLSEYNSSLFTSFGTGTFDIEAAIDGIAVRYSLSLARTWLLIGVVAGLMYGLPAPRSLIWSALWPFPAAVLTALVVVHYAVTKGRVWFWLKRGLAGVSELSMKP